MEALILQMILTYGPEVVTGVTNLVNKLESGGQLTITDVQAEFAPLKPYSAYGIVKAFTPSQTIINPVPTNASIGTFQTTAL
jgi:hypothetical protein